MLTINNTYLTLQDSKSTLTYDIHQKKSAQLTILSCPSFNTTCQFVTSS